MLKNVKPKSFSSTQFQAVAQASAQQTGNAVIPKTNDPNFPTFETPVNKKVLVYVPNFTVDNGNGEEMVMDKGAFHQIIVGTSFYNKRCYSGIIAPDDGYDGTCPYCEAMGECWELFNADWEQVCKQNGVLPENADDSLKEKKKELLKKMAIAKADIYITFPLIVIECEPDSTKPKLGADNSLVYQAYWYTLRESTYKEKWVKSFEGIETEDDSVITHPAGRFFTLDFTYESKSGQWNKRDSTRALKVTHKSMKNIANVCPALDEYAKEWTPEKASQTLYANYFLELTDAKDIADEAMKSTRDRLTMFRGVTQAGAVAIEGGNAPEAIIGAFSGTPATGTDATANTGVGTAPQIELGQTEA